MANPLVFISHSTNGDDAAKTFLQGLLTELEGSCQLLYDHDSLRLGEDWRSAINVWVGTCDAAIVLVTDKALASPYCIYERNILSYRRNTGGKLLVIPIFYNVNPNALPNDPAQLAEIQSLQQQSIDHADVVEMAKKIKTALANLQTVSKPTEAQANVIAMLLRKNIGDLNVYKDAADLFKIDLHLGTWQPFVDEWKHHALRLMGLGLGRVTPLLRQLRDHFNPPSKDWKNLVELIACSWVDNRCAEVVRQRALRTDLTARGVSLNTATQRTARLYALAASGRNFTDSWPVAGVNGVVASYQELEDELLVAVRAALQLDPMATANDVLEELAELDRNKQPVLACLPGDGFEPSWLPELRKRFPTITVFFLHGDSRAAGLSDAEVERLLPPVERAFETKFWEDYDVRTKHLYRNLAQDQ